MLLRKFLPRLIRSALDNDTASVRRTSLSILRAIRLEYPDVASEIAKALSFSDVGQSAIRSVGLEPVPSDFDNHDSLLNITEPTNIPEPILDPKTKEQILLLFQEQNRVLELLEYGLEPTKSVLLLGPPGVGKTHLASYIASHLNLPLLTLDLATAISSYLGKTGHNLKKVLEYGQVHRSVLFLDEFDAIAKRRDDPSDLGELKRIVNVLLKELDDWPHQSIVVAATNHPEILDRAIWRRFDLTLTLSLPEINERKELFDLYLPDEMFSKSLREIAINLTDGCSGADIKRLCEKSIKASILDGSNANRSLLTQLSSKHDGWSSQQKTEFAILCKTMLGETVSSRDIAKMLNVSHTTVLRWLKNYSESEGL